MLFISSKTNNRTTTLLGVSMKLENGEMETTDTKADEAKKLLRSWLNKSMKVQMTDGRTLIGLFLCTDRDRNLILGSCEEYLKPPEPGVKKEEPRILGLAMVPGRHIVSIHVD